MPEQGSGAPRRGVCFAAGESASSAFFELLREAAAHYPQVFASVALPSDPRSFKATFAGLLPRLESARIASMERAEVARFLVGRSHGRLRFVEPSGAEIGLAQALREPGMADRTREVPLAGSGRLVPRVRFEGREFRGVALAELAGVLRERHWISPAAARALAFVGREAVDEAGEIDLSGRRFALLGAGAEIAPTQMLLEAGAEVLWLDLRPPPQALAKDSALSGRLHVPERSTNLLMRPRAVRATLARFAADGPFSLGLYAYAPGRGREWLLAAAMNAVVDALEPTTVEAVALLVSPASPCCVGEAELADLAARRARRPAWQALLDRLGVLGPAGVVVGPGTPVVRSVVSLQGVSYQAAQYIEKLLAAETWASAGVGAAQGGPEVTPPRISANTAAITRTRSLRHAVFQAAYAGAPFFGVHTFAPELTRPLNGLLLLYDLLRPPLPRSPDSSENAAPLFPTQVHGGLFGLPYALEPCLRVAALLGFVRHPALLRGFLRH